MDDFKPSLDPTDVKQAPYQHLFKQIPQIIKEMLRQHTQDGVSAIHAQTPIPEETTQKLIKQAEATVRFTNLTPEDGRYREQVQELAPFLSEAAYIRARVILEALWLRFQMNEVLPPGTLNLKQEDLLKIFKFADEMPVEFTLRVGEIEAIRNHDVISVIEAIREKFADVLTPETEGYFHLGLTSEDVSDFAQKFMFINALKKSLLPKAEKLIKRFRETGERLDSIKDPTAYGYGTPPFSVGARYKAYGEQIAEFLEPVFNPDYLTMKFSGATGTHAAMGIIKKEDITGREIGAKFTGSIAPGLNYLPVTAQINPHDDFVIWCGYALKMVEEIEKICSCIWEDSGLDIWEEEDKEYIIASRDPELTSMAEAFRKPHGKNYPAEAPVSKADRMLFIKPGKGQSGSSAMPQKVQIIATENARGNAQLVAGTLKALKETLSINKQQRELSDSRKIREMLGDVLPKLLMILTNIDKDLAKLEPNPACIHKGPLQTKGHNIAPNIYCSEETLDNLLEQLSEKSAALKGAAEFYADVPMLGRTHNQPASPVTLGQVFRTYAGRFDYCLEYFRKNKTSELAKSLITSVTDRIEANLHNDLLLYVRRGIIRLRPNPARPLDRTSLEQDLIVNEKRCHDELENHYESLGEAVQTILRRYQVPNAYEIVKKVTRGAQMNREQYRTMILDIMSDPIASQKLPEEAKNYLLNLRPRNFTGEAAELARL